MDVQVITVDTQAYQDQKPGTSGLRKKVAVFKGDFYTENFIQSILEANNEAKFLVVGGDGRYYSDEAIKKIISICAGNGLRRLVIAQNGILSTPAASALIRSLKADGGIILTASHNPGGPEADFGIKYNIANGGPAPEAITDKIYQVSKSLSSFKSLLKRPKVDLSILGTHQIGQMSLEIVDPIENYLQLMKQVFDFDKIKKNLFAPATVTSTTTTTTTRIFKMLADPMNGVVGPYAKRILIDELGAPESSLINGQPLVDFGGKHPDPNLTYADELVQRLRSEADLDFGVAFDGDGDRNMILGAGAFFVTPGDSLAVIGAHLSEIKYFDESAGNRSGFARSFPTSPAVDRVAKARGLQCFETPTGWKYFGNLMDARLLCLCGEESFGTGSSHIREKDGLWACLAWLSIMAGTGKTVRQVVEEHWQQFGRDYFCRYDFEDCDSDKCQAMMRELEAQLCAAGCPMRGKRFSDANDGREYVVEETGNFEYTDPVDKSVSSRQGLFVKFTNGARIIVRLSGTGSSGATVRLYVSDYSRDQLMEDSQVFLKQLLEIAYSISRLPEFTGRDKPTVIT